MAEEDAVPPTGGKSQDLPPIGWMGTDDASNQVIKAHEAIRRRAVAATTEFYVPPPLQAPVLAGVKAAVLAGEGSLSANARVAEGVGDTRHRVEFAQRLSEHPAEIRDAAHVLAQAVKEQITELKAARRNDTDTGDFINFLEMIAHELDRLVDALDRAIESPAEQQPIFLGEAGKVANHLKTGVYEYLEQHRADIAGYSIKIGLVSAAAWFLHACGFDLASIASILKK